MDKGVQAITPLKYANYKHTHYKANPLTEQIDFELYDINLNLNFLERNLKNNIINNNLINSQNILQFSNLNVR